MLINFRITRVPAQTGHVQSERLGEQDFQSGWVLNEINRYKTGVKQI